MKSSILFWDFFVDVHAHQNGFMILGCGMSTKHWELLCTPGRWSSKSSARRMLSPAPGPKIRGRRFGADTRVVRAKKHKVRTRAGIGGRPTERTRKCTEQVLTSDSPLHLQPQVPDIGVFVRFRCALGYL